MSWKSTWKRRDARCCGNCCRTIWTCGPGGRWWRYEPVHIRRSSAPTAGLGPWREAGHARCLACMFGLVRVERIAHRGPGAANVHPADEALRLPGERHSMGLRRLAVTEAVRGSFDLAPGGDRWGTPDAAPAHGPPADSRRPVRRRPSASDSHARVPTTPRTPDRSAVSCGVRARTTIRSPSSATPSMTNGARPENTVCTSSLASFTRMPTALTTPRYHRM